VIGDPGKEPALSGENGHYTDWPCEGFRPSSLASERGKKSSDVSHQRPRLFYPGLEIISRFGQQ
jgi:hypothetical protein